VTCKEMKNALFVAWHANQNPHKTDSVWGPVGKLEYEAGVYRFFYTRGSQSLPGFQPFDGMEDFSQVYESRELFPLFANRLLPSSRPDFRSYLTWSGFDPDDPPEPLVLLGRTGGTKQTDAVELFPCPVPNSHGRYLNFFFAHGIRYHIPNATPVIANLHSGDLLQLRPQPLNPADPNALAIVSDSTPLGYVPRYLASDIKKLIEDCPDGEVRIFVQSVNVDAPIQQRLLCRLESCWPAGFQPCDGEQFQPIQSGCEAA
jgi:hypothetical protein